MNKNWFEIVRKNQWLSALVTLFVLVTIGRTCSQLLSECESLPRFGSPWLLAAMLLAIAYRVTNAYGWALVLRSIGYQVDGKTATRIWLRAESRRWLPGGIWGYASRAVQAKELGVSPATASASMLLELILTLLAALVVTISVTFIYRQELWNACNSLNQPAWLVGFGVVVVIAVMVGIICCRKIITKNLNDLLIRFQALKSLSICARSMAIAFAFYVGMSLFNGLVTLALLYSIPTQALSPAVIVAATSWAWIVGFFAVFAPGGLIVREGVFAACLSPWVPYSTGFTLAILCRLLQMVAEFICMIWVYSDCREWFARLFSGSVRQVAK